MVNTTLVHLAQFHNIIACALLVNNPFANIHQLRDKGNRELRQEILSYTNSHSLTPCKKHIKYKFN